MQNWVEFFLVDTIEPIVIKFPGEYKLLLKMYGL